MTAIDLILVFIVALAATAAAIPPIRKMAVLRKLLDMPDGDRRSHQRPIPRLGGVGVFAGFLIAVLIGVVFNRLSGTEPHSITHLLQLLGACTILFGIGLADDIRGVPPLIKLLGQTAAALVVQYHWALLPAIAFPPDITVHLGWLGTPIMVLWLVGMSNALNLVDGLDGLAGGVSAIALVATVAASFVLQNGTGQLAAVALIGAVAGFLIYNWSPATIFLGDSGSLVVGFLLAFMAVRSSVRADGAVLVLVPVFALSYPLLDTGLAMLRRWLRGHPLSRADGRHVHHQLLALGLEDRKAVSIIYLYSAAVAGLGLSVTFAPPAFTVAIAACGAAILAFVFLYGVRWLEYHEFMEAGAIFAAAGTLARSAIRDSIQAHDVANLIEKATSLLEIDEVLGSHASSFGFRHMQVGPCDAKLVLHDGLSLRSHWKLEYPIVYRQDSAPSVTEASDGSLVLTIWCSKQSTGRSASAERVSRVIADAVSQWSLSAANSSEREILTTRAATPPSVPVTRQRPPAKPRHLGTEVS